ncbi:MAG: hypothetical protein ABI416_10710 [Ginsengibacter sp.]
MRPKEVNMTEAESLLLITSMINKAKNRFSESGTIYILWGWLILICCVVQFVALYYFNNQDAYSIWYVTWLAPIYQLFSLRKSRKSRPTKTYTDEIIGFVWVVFIICLALLVFILMHLKAYLGISPAVLIMYGMPTVLTGVILKFRPLLIGGVCCWLLAVLSTMVIYEFQLLMIAFAVAVAWIVPGYLLQQKFKRELILK